MSLCHLDTIKEARVYREERARHYSSRIHDECQGRDGHRKGLCRYVTWIP